MKYKHNSWFFVISINNQKRKLLQFLKNIFSIQIYIKPEIWILSLGILAHLSYPFPASAASFKKFNSLQQCWKAFLNKEEFETEEDNHIKEKAVEAIREIETKDSKTQNILADSLEFFKGEKKASIRIKIYSLFESISQHITVKVARKLAALIRGRLPSEEKKHIITILRKRGTKDTLTIQYLGEGLNDLSPEVRETTAEALGEILGGKQNILKTFFYESYIYPLIVYPSKTMFDLDNTVKYIRLYIIKNLAHTASYDPAPFVQEAAIKAMVKIIHVHFDGFGGVIDTLLEIILSNSDSKVKTEAIFNLEKSLDTNFKKRFFYFITKITQGRSDIIRKLTNSLYDKDQGVRKEARKAFRILNGKKALKEYYDVQDLKAKYLEIRIKEYDSTGNRLTYDNPNSQPINKVPPPFESWFEVEVFLEIHKKGYIVLPQPVYSTSEERPNYRIDMVVISSDKNSYLAVECDGPLHNEIERQKEDKNRQKELESAGWSVWKIRHSEEKTPLLSGPPFYSYYPNWKDREIRKESLQDLWEKLERNEH